MRAMTSYLRARIRLGLNSTLKYTSHVLSRIMGLNWVGFACSAICCFVAARATNKTAFERRCLSFKPETFVYNSTRTILEFVKGGTNVSFPDNDPSCSRPYQIVSTDICRVALSIPTSDRSSITYEHWLPESWTGRFLATGNGGIDGCS